MAVALGDVVTPAALFPYTAATSAADNLAAGMIVELPLLGVVSNAAGVDVTWNTGVVATGIVNDTLRFVGAAAAATVTALRGRVVRLISPASQETTGVVVSVFALEAGTVGKTGDANVVTDEVVIFRTRQGQYILAAVSSVEVVSGQ